MAAVLLGVGALATEAAGAVTSESYGYSNVVIGGTGFMPGIVFHPTEPGLAYIRADMGGAYRLDAATRTWIPIHDFHTSYETSGVESIALDARDADRVFLVSGTAVWAPNAILHRSANRGATWDHINLPFKAGANDGGRSLGERLVVDPHLGTTLFMGTRQVGLYKSTDRGSTWARVNSFPITDTTGGTWPNAGLSFVLFDPRTGTDGSATQTIYVGAATTGTNLYRSTDGGTTWAAVPGQPTMTDGTARGTSSAMLPHHAVLAANGLLYVTYTSSAGPDTSDGEAYKLDTATGTWTRITPAKGGWGGPAGLAVHPTDGNIVMVSTTGNYGPDNEVWRSTNGGSTWKAVKATGVRDASSTPFLYWGGSTVGMGNWIEDLEIDPTNPDRVLYVTGATVWGCDDISELDASRPTHWQPRARGIEETAVLDLASPPSGPRLMSAVGDVGGFVHTDLTVSPPGGMLRPTYTTQTSVDFAEAVPQQMVRVGRATDWSSGSGIQSGLGSWSGDAGATWTAFTSPVPQSDSNNDGGTVALTADGGAVLWAMSNTRPYRSTDHGQTWTACTGLTAYAKPVADRVNPAKAYALIYGNSGSASVYRSTDGGASFALASTISAWLTDSRLKAMPGFEGRLYVGSWNGLYRSTNSGTAFSRVNTAVTVVNSLGFGAPAPGSSTPAIFITGTVSGVDGVFRSDDDGISWVRCNDDLHRWGGWGTITGDPRTHGRYYLGTNGRGIIIGERIIGGVLGLTGATATVAETAGSVGLNVSRTNGNSGAVSVAWSTRAMTAVAGTDYVAANGVLTWAAGDSTDKTITVSVLQNGVWDSGRTLAVDLGSVNGAVLGTITSSTITITNSDARQPGTLGLVSDAVVPDSGGNAQLTVRRSGGTDGPVSATWATANGTALAGTHYTAVGATLNWAHGDGSDRTLTVPILAENTHGNAMTAFSVTLTSVGGGAVAGDLAATVTIIDDDPVQPGTVTFVSASGSVSEAAGTATVAWLRRSGGSDGAVTATWVTVDGTALAGSDYSTGSGTVAWADHDLADKPVVVAIIDDGDRGGNETFQVRLTGTGGGLALGSATTSTITINDNDPLVPGVLAVVGSGTVTVSETAGTVTVAVGRSGAFADGSVSVAWATSPGTAGGRFVAANGTLSWTDGDQSQKLITIALVNDAIGDQGTQAFTVVLSTPTGGAALGSPISATVQVTDDDPSPLVITGFSIRGSARGAGVNVTRSPNSVAWILDGSGWIATVFSAGGSFTVSATDAQGGSDVRPIVVDPGVVTLPAPVGRN